MNMSFLFLLSQPQLKFPQRLFYVWISSAFPFWFYFLMPFLLPLPLSVGHNTVSVCLLHPLLIIPEKSEGYKITGLIALVSESRNSECLGKELVLLPKTTHQQEPHNRFWRSRDQNGETVLWFLEASQVLPEALWSFGLWVTFITINCLS